MFYIKELVSNCVKHSKSDKIICAITYSNSIYLNNNFII
jgi:signal transduction histidine kinase